MDGFVDGLDLGILLANFDQNGIPASGGELNDTDPVDGLDLGILLGAWNPPPPPGRSSAVPEKFLKIGFPPWKGRHQKSWSKASLCATRAWQMQKLDVVRTLTKQ